MPKLSILIPTLPSREQDLANLFKQIHPQIGPLENTNEIKGPRYSIAYYDHGEVEIITCLDHRQMSVGKKRNMLKGCANGKYLTYIDDDDKISGDYFKEILPLCDGDTHLITFYAQMYDGGRLAWNVVYHPRYTKDRNKGGRNLRIPDELFEALAPDLQNKITRRRPGVPGVAERIPNHLMVWRSDIAKTRDFPDINMGEDGQWALKMRSKVRKFKEVHKVLYFYMFDPQKTETQRKR